MRDDVSRNGAPHTNVSRASAAQQPSCSHELWALKHAPIGEEELAVHKKKVADVKGWLQQQVVPGDQMRNRNRLLILTGKLRQ